MKTIDPRACPTDEFKSIDDLQEWMTYNGQIWFYVHGHYYFMYSIKWHEEDEQQWHLDYDSLDELYVQGKEDVACCSSFHDLVNAPLFNGHSITELFFQIIFYDRIAQSSHNS